MLAAKAGKPAKVAAGKPVKSLDKSMLDANKNLSVKDKITLLRETLANKGSQSLDEEMHAAWQFARLRHEFVKVWQAFDK